MKTIATLFTVIILSGLMLFPMTTMSQNSSSPDPADPVRLGIARMEHGHIHGFLRRYAEREDVKLVGIYEPDTSLARRYAEQYGLADSLFFTDLKKMIRERRPGGVAIYSNTYAHKELVETIAATGTHIMMEKPLAVSMEHARAMKKAVGRNNVHLIVNYVTSWYPSNHYIYRQVKDEQSIGNLRKIVHHAGHRGPEEIGVRDPFLSWLTNPKLNGGGALFDFGCYGANLMTWLMDGRVPTSVTAVTQQLKKDSTYAEVDDEATIILNYPDAQGIIQASWNWPYPRKDMVVYGTGGYFHAPDPHTVKMRMGDDSRMTKEVSKSADRYADSLTYFRDVIQGNIEPYGLSSLENNLTVTRILEAARTSANIGKTIQLKQGQ